MINSLLILLVIIFLQKIRPIRPFSHFNNLYLERSVSSAFKGVLALLVVLHHLAQRTNDVFLFHQFFRDNGYLFTGGFFFLSGYGLQKSYITIPNYKKSFLIKRFSSVLFPYILVIGIYWILKNDYTFYNVLKQLFENNTFVPFSWFIINIIYLYLIFYFTMSVSKKRKALMIISTTLGTFLWIYICKKLIYGGWWYNTTFLFVFGIIWASYEEKFLFCLKKYLAIILSILMITLCFTYGTTMNEIKFLNATIFVAMILILSLKFRIGNNMLSFLGTISLEIYLLQGIFIEITRQYIHNDSYWCCAVFILDIIGAYVLHMVIFKLKLLKQKILN